MAENVSQHFGHLGNKQYCLETFIGHCHVDLVVGDKYFYFLKIYKHLIFECIEFLLVCIHHSPTAYGEIFKKLFR